MSTLHISAASGAIQSLRQLPGGHRKEWEASPCRTSFVQGGLGRQNAGPALRLMQSPPSAPILSRRGVRQLCARASLSTGETDAAGAAPPAVASSAALEEPLALLRRAAATRKVAAPEVFAALLALEKAKVDASHFLPTIGGSKSPGRTWMLVFTSGTKEVRDALKGGLGGGKYFPITAVQRFDAQAMEIENGVYLGAFGQLTFKGPFGWANRRLPFTFNTLSVRIGGLGPFSVNIGKKADAGRVPGVGKEGKDDPFFIFFYADDSIVAARGRGGGVAFWVRCSDTKDGFKADLQ